MPRCIRPTLPQPHPGIRKGIRQTKRGQRRGRTLNGRHEQDPKDPGHKRGPKQQTRSRQPHPLPRGRRSARSRHRITRSPEMGRPRQTRTPQHLPNMKLGHRTEQMDHLRRRIHSHRLRHSSHTPGMGNASRLTLKQPPKRETEHSDRTSHQIS